MESIEAKFTQTPQPIRTQKIFLGAQICLRILVIATTLAATWMMLTSKESTLVYGLAFNAKYSYSSAFKFFAFANGFACAFTLVSLLLAFIAGRRGMDPSKYFFLFLNDLCMMSLVLAGCAAATTMGYLGKYGNSHAGWLPICQYLSKFCNRVTTSVILSYLSFLFLLALTLISTSRSRQIQV